MSNWRHWLHGLVSATIGGAASAITNIIVAPDQFNFLDPTARERLLAVTVVSGLFSAAFYLKQSPLPSEKETSK